jgi:hypothetical protein
VRWVLLSFYRETDKPQPGSPSGRCLATGQVTPSNSTLRSVWEGEKKRYGFTVSFGQKPTTRQGLPFALHETMQPCASYENLKKSTKSTKCAANLHDLCVSLRFTSSCMLPMCAQSSLLPLHRSVDNRQQIVARGTRKPRDTCAHRTRGAPPASLCVGGNAMKAAKKRTGTDKPLYGSQEEIYPLFACVEPQVASKDQGES